MKALNSVMIILKPQTPNGGPQLFRYNIETGESSSVVLSNFAGSAEDFSIPRDRNVGYTYGALISEAEQGRVPLASFKGIDLRDTSKLAEQKPSGLSGIVGQKTEGTQKSTDDFEPEKEDSSTLEEDLIKAGKAAEDLLEKLF